MRSHAALLVGALVLLGGCLGGAGVIGGGTDGQTTEGSPPTNVATETDGTDTADRGAETESTTDDEENVTATFVVEGSENPTVSLEVADEEDERREGLMHRQSLPENHGMVFVYDDAEPRTFWMKNTLVPLDIIFVAPNGTVIDIEHARTQPNASDSELDRYRSDGDAKYAVELERGFANRTGVEPGTELVFNESAPEAEDRAW